MTPKNERKFETRLKEGNPDLMRVWLEVARRLKEGENHARKN